jgi:signal transduction histidine kinase
MNILSNAIDALEEATANRDYQDLQVHRQWIRIRTRIQEIELPSTNPTGSSLSDSKPSTRSKWLVVGIADNGPGIPPDIQRRIFDPFFTTKPIGKGTGMGMSISYQIVVEKHQGKLECFSQVGEGTEFLIQIPLNLGAKYKD